MADEHKSPQVEIIALEFYDGATEGFARSVGIYGISYFKLIAWDDNQDQRLFVVISTAKLIFDTIFNLLSLGNEVPNSPVWLPKWSFNNDQDETKANEIIDICVSDIKSKGVLVLSDQIDSGPTSTFTINDNLVQSIHDAMKKPESLDSWLKKLKET